MISNMCLLLFDIEIIQKIILAKFYHSVLFMYKFNFIYNKISNHIKTHIAKNAAIFLYKVHLAANSHPIFPVLLLYLL